MNESAINPSHYNQGNMEVIDAIEGLCLGFHEGNVLKYMARAKFKGSEIEDLQKAHWYLLRLLASKKQEFGHSDQLTTEERKVLRINE